MVFLVWSRKMIFLFSKNMILFFRHKRKNDLSQKKYLEICFFQMFWKGGLSKKFEPEHDLFCNIWKDGISFFRKYDIFSLGKKWKKMIFIKKRMEMWYFLYIRVGAANMTLPSWQKKKILLPPKNIPKDDFSVISKKDDAHPRKYDISAEIPHRYAL